MLSIPHSFNRTGSYSPPFRFKPRKHGIMVKKNTILYGVRGNPEMGRKAEAVQLPELRFDV